MSAWSAPLAAQAAPPAVERTPQAGESCPLCGAPLHVEQDWCLNCGAAARTRLAGAPNWKVPVATLALIAVLSLAVLVAALVKLAGDVGAPAPVRTRTVTIPVAPAAVTPPPTATTPTAPGATGATPGTPQSRTGAGGTAPSGTAGSGALARRRLGSGASHTAVPQIKTKVAEALHIAGSIGGR
jgi:hypothetical protein